PLLFLLLLLPTPPRSALFPYTTLFRSSLIRLLTLILIHIFHHFICYIHSHHHPRHVRSNPTTFHFSSSHTIGHGNLLVFLYVTDHPMRSRFNNHILYLFWIRKAIDIKRRNRHA